MKRNCINLIPLFIYLFCIITTRICAPINKEILSKTNRKEETGSDLTGTGGDDDDDEDIGTYLDNIDLSLLGFERKADRNSFINALINSENNKESIERVYNGLKKLSKMKNHDDDDEHHAFTDAFIDHLKEKINRSTSSPVSADDDGNFDKNDAGGNLGYGDDVEESENNFQKVSATDDSDDKLKTKSDLPKSRNSRNKLMHALEILEKLRELRLREGSQHTKRGEGPQLSVIQPIDVLRQQLLLAMEQKNLKKAEMQIEANKEILQHLGKRSIPERVYFERQAEFEASLSTTARSVKVSEIFVTSKKPSSRSDKLKTQSH